MPSSHLRRRRDSAVESRRRRECKHSRDPVTNLLLSQAASRVANWLQNWKLGHDS